MKKTIIPALFFACCAPAAGFAHTAYPLAVKAEKGNGADFMHALRTGKTAQLKNITATERTALEFLYRYMPLADVTDYSPEFFLDNVRRASWRRRRCRGEAKCRSCCSAISYCR